MGTTRNKESANTAWHYSLATGWTKGPDPVADSPEEEIEDQIKAAGYRRVHASGGTIAGSGVSGIAEIYGGPGETYFIWVDMGRYAVPVYVPDFPSLLDVLNKCAPLATQGLTGRIIESLEAILPKWFQAYHGHDYADACMTCDPWTTKARQEARSKAQLQKVGS